MTPDPSTERAVLEGLRDALRAALHLDKTACQVTADGRPDPMCGEWFYAVHPGGTSNTQRNYLDESADCSVTITRRTGFSPQDRIGEEAVFELLDRAGKVKSIVHMEYPTMDASNRLIPGTAKYCEIHGGTATTNGFVEPLGFRSQQYLGPQGNSWFWAEGMDDAVTGIAVRLDFAGARRIVASDVDT